MCDHPGAEPSAARTCRDGDAAAGRSRGAPMPCPASYCRAVAAVLSLMLLLSGCARLTGAGPETRALQRQIESRVLDDARQAFVRADYANAIHLLHRFVRAYPRSSLSPEARWWLARSYQGAGDLPSAAEQFRLLAAVPPPNFYRDAAMERAAQLEDLPPPAGAGDGVLVRLDSFHASGDPAFVVEDARVGAGAVVLLDVPCGRDGNGTRREQPSSIRTMGTTGAMDDAVRRLHDRGMAVYLGVTLRCVGQAAEERRAPEQWRDWEYHPASGALRRSSFYSPAFGGYREFLIDWFSQLRDLPLAGLVFRAEAPPGIHEGFSPPALAAFQRAFDVRFDPVRVLTDAGPPSATAAAAATADAELPAVFWKWAGWKARERLRILRTLVDTLRLRLPRLRFGLEVRRESLVDPVYGLAHFADDWAAMARGPFDVFLTTGGEADPASPAPRIESRDSSARGKCSAEDSKNDPVARMARRLENPGTLWVIVPRRTDRAPGRSCPLPDGARRVYDRRVMP